MSSSLIHKLRSGLKDYLSFSRSEQKGIFVLLIILLSLVLSNILFPASSDHPPVDFSSFEKEIIAFERAWQKAKDEEKQKKRNFFIAHDTAYPSVRKPRIDFTVEINSADTFELQRLRGIGPSFARRIIGYRKRLGGFTRKEQLLEVFGMDSSRYSSILPNLTVIPDSVHRIDLNNVTFKDLLKHPYFPFEVTKAIMIYRQKNKKFRSTDELKGIEGVTDSVFRRMVPYLRVGP
ncbi:MAG: helix-hairpin-helix domain-containing protein [bacterium]